MANGTDVILGLMEFAVLSLTAMAIMFSTVVKQFEEVPISDDSLKWRSAAIVGASGGVVLLVTGSLILLIRVYSIFFSESGFPEGPANPLYIGQDLSIAIATIIIAFGVWFGVLLLVGSLSYSYFKRSRKDVIGSDFEPESKAE